MIRSEEEIVNPFARGENDAQLQAKLFILTIALLTRGKGKGKSGFDLTTPRATPAEMQEAVRQLEQGAGKLSSRMGPALAKTHQLTDLQKRGLEENVRCVINITIPAVKNGSAVQGLKNQMSNPRFRFLDQVPEAKSALEEALEGTGVPLPSSGD